MTENNQDHDRKTRRNSYNNSDLLETKDSNFNIRQPRFTLEKDVVLPEISKLHIDEALVKIRNHKTIYIDWGFAEVDPLGKGVVLNFYGKPGTGKTLTAEALAGSLGLPFISIGIAELESKFMGETSKNIQLVFNLSREHNAVLFFDEADTLLGKRLSSVTQGVDNEVNAMRSTMLIELEQFEGIAIFATNFAENYDKAFESRISHHVHFDLPDFNGRQAIWDKMLVPKIPLATDRSILINEATNLTNGFSGRDIRTCMRLSLPKVLLADVNNSNTLSNNSVGLDVSHLTSAINQINKAKQEIGKNIVEKSLGESDLNISKKLLGLNKIGEE